MNKAKLIGEFKLRGVHREMGADDPARLEELEKLIGTRLPEDYRQFLLELAPSHFYRYVCYRPLEPNPWGHNGLNEVGVFLGLYKGNMYDVIRSYEIHSGDGFIPSNTLTISIDSAGNRLLLALAEPAGRIYFQDKNTGKNHLCANSFTELLDRCEIDYDNDDDEEEEEKG